MVSMRPIAVALTAAVLAVAASAQFQIEVARDGRPIQLDGFLPEWRARHAKAFAGSDNLLWDVMGTKEGLAGYLRCSTADSCRPALARIYPDFPALDHSWRIDLGPDTATPWLSRAADGAGPAVVEFMAPWDSLPLDRAGAYSLAVGAFGACGDTIGFVIVKGVRRMAVSSILSRRLVVQFGVIAALFGAYLALMLRVRRKTRRTESPRRSA